MRIIIILIAFFLVETLAAQKDGIRLNVRSLFGYNKSNEVVSDTLRTSNNPNSNTLQSSYDFSIGYLFNYKNNNFFTDLGFQSYSRPSRQVQEIDSILYKRVEDRKSKGVVLNIGIMKFYQFPNTKLSTSVGLGLYSAWNYLDNYNSEIFLTDLNGRYLQGRSRNINYNDFFSFGPNAEINIYYNFKKFAFGINHNSRIYVEFEKGTVIDENQTFKENKIKIDQERSFQYIEKKVISKAQYFTISILKKF